MDLSTGELTVYPFLASPEDERHRAEGTEAPENVLFASFEHGIQGMGDRECGKSRQLRVGTVWTAEQDRWTPASLPAVSRVTVLGFHRSDH